VGGARTRSSASTMSAAITTGELPRRLEIISDDSMMGRESGSEGDYKTAAYIAAEFRRIGLEPAGENGTYFQTVPFWTVAVDPTSTLDAAGTALVVWRDFVPAGIAAPRRAFAGVRSIYGGSAADSSHWISASQAAGKVVVLERLAEEEGADSRSRPVVGAMPPLLPPSCSMLLDRNALPGLAMVSR
jgi:hypothetical protein